MKQNDPMSITKEAIYALAISVVASSCTNEQSSYFDEEKLLTDSIVTTDGNGNVTSRVNFFRDEAGRDTLAIFASADGTIRRTTVFGKDSTVEFERITSRDITQEVTYTTNGKGKVTEVHSRSTSQGVEEWQHTLLTLDGNGKATASESTSSDGSQSKVETERDENGNETKVTQMRRNGSDEAWEPMTQQTYSYDDSLVTKGALAVWEDGQWRKVSEVTYMRDEQGHVTKQIEKADEVTVTTKYTFDKAGNLNRKETYTNTGDGSPDELTSIETTRYDGMKKTETTYDERRASDGRLEQTLQKTSYFHKAP